MDDILLANSKAETLEKIFEEVKEVLTCQGLQIAPEKIQRGDFINYLGYKIGLQKIRPQKVQIRRDQYQTLNDLQKLLGEIFQLQTIIRIEGHDLTNLKKTLKGNKDLNSPRILSAEAKKELEWVVKTNTRGTCRPCGYKVRLYSGYITVQGIPFRDFNAEERYHI